MDVADAAFFLIGRGVSVEPVMLESFLRGEPVLRIVDHQSADEVDHLAVVLVVLVALQDEPEVEFLCVDGPLRSKRRLSRADVVHHAAERPRVDLEVLVLLSSCLGR